MIKQKTNRTKLANVVVLLFLGFVFITLLAAALAYVNNKVNNIEDNPGNLRELLVASLKGTTKDAPVDAQSGDSYFPEMKLFIPRADKTVAEYLYSFDTYQEDGVQKNVLSVTSRPITDSALVGINNAVKTESTFNALPKAQACQRGIAISDSELKDKNDRVFVESIKIADGRTLSFYTEPTCPELKNELMKELRTVQPY